MATVSVRYIVNDVDEAITFYCGQLGFQEVMHPGPAFAMLSKGDLRLVLTSRGVDPEAAGPCPMDPYLSQEVGTASRLKSPTRRHGRPSTPERRTLSQ